MREHGQRLPFRGPPDLASAFDDEARAAFERISYSHRKDCVDWIEEARRPETRSAGLLGTSRACAV